MLLPSEIYVRRYCVLKFMFGDIVSCCSTNHNSLLSSTPMCALHLCYSTYNKVMISLFRYFVRPTNRNSLLSSTPMCALHLCYSTYNKVMISLFRYFVHPIVCLYRGQPSQPSSIHQFPALQNPREREAPHSPHESYSSDTTSGGTTLAPPSYFFRQPFCKHYEHRTGGRDTGAGHLF
jgi:hypothetical protein